MDVPQTWAPERHVLREPGMRPCVLGRDVGDNWISVSPPRGGMLITATSGLGELRSVVEVAGLPRLEEGDRDAGRTVACPG